MEVVVAIGQLILSLSILVVLHEMGHFIPARLFNTKVEKFYLFFDPWFSLFKFKKGDTEYGIGWLPLGGYVKIAGMVDESFDKEQLKQEPKEWEFRSKPAWQRLIILLGGITVNVILGFILFGMVKFVWGDSYLASEDATYGIYADSLGLELGLENGDHILSIGGEPFDNFNDAFITQAIVIDGATEMVVKRNGVEQTIDIDPYFSQILSAYENKDKDLFIPRTPFVIGKISKDFPAEKAGLMVNDSITGIDSVAISYYDEFKAAVEGKDSTEILVSYVRDGVPGSTLLTTTAAGTIGVFSYGNDRYFDLSTKKYSIGEAIPAGIKAGVNFLGSQLKAYKRIANNDIKLKDSVGGFYSITQMFGSNWVWYKFWTLTASLSLILAIMNLLPIPALDGGHVMFLLYEIVTGRPPGDKFMEIANVFGLIVVLALMILVNGLDFMRGCM